MILKVAALAFFAVAVSADPRDNFNCRYNAGEQFTPYSSDDLGTSYCSVTRIGEQSLGRCADKEVCQNNGGWSVSPNLPVDEGDDCWNLPNPQCCVITETCTALSLDGNKTMGGYCTQPKYCTNAASQAPQNGECAATEEGEALVCCVEQKNHQEVTCPEGYQWAITRFNQVLRTMHIQPDRLENFLPYIMDSYVPQYCPHLGDCSGAAFRVFAWRLLEDFTAFKPNEIWQKILDNAKDTGAMQEFVSKPQAEALISNIKNQLAVDGDHDGFMTPEAYGEFVATLWKELDLDRFGAGGTCGDFLQMGQAVLGYDHGWKCDKVWEELMQVFKCRATRESNGPDCANGKGICFILDSDEIPAGRYPPIASSDSDCKGWNSEAQCLSKNFDDSTTMTFDTNEYRNVRVGIDADVAGDLTEQNRIIEDIKRQFNDASARMYTATRERALLRSVRIILPSTWDASLATAARTNERIEESEFIMRPNVDTSNFADDELYSTMNTVQVGYCGAKGLGTVFTDRDLTQRFFSQNIVKHFAMNQYGIFREFPKNEIETKYDPDTPLRDQYIPRCVQTNDTHYLYCKDYMELEWVAQTGTATASLAWLPDWHFDIFNAEKMIHFCDSRKCDPDTNHNEAMTNTHNRVCNKQPTFDVMLKSDHLGSYGTPVRPGLDTTTEFVIVHDNYQGRQGVPARHNIVLAIDASETVQGYLDNFKLAAAEFIGTLSDNFNVAIVSFNHLPTVKSELVNCNEQGKQKLREAIASISSEGYTCIKKAVATAAEVLEQANVNGGQIVIVSDSYNTKGGPNGQTDCGDYDGVDDVLERQNIMVHTVTLNNAEPSVNKLASSTRGRNFHVANPNDLTHYLLAFDSAAIALGSDDVLNRGIVTVEQVELSKGSTVEVEVNIDTELDQGTVTINVFYHSGVLPVVATLKNERADSGIVCNGEAAVVGNILTCRVSSKCNCKWTLEIKSTADYDPSFGATTVTVSATVVTTNELTIRGAMQQGQIAFEPQPDRPDWWWWIQKTSTAQTIVASPSHGELSIVHAKMWAIIESTANGIQFREEIELVDDGEGYEDLATMAADLYEHDGVYSAVMELSKFALQPGRYTVTIKMESEADRTFYNHHLLVGFWKTWAWIERYMEDSVFVYSSRIIQIGTFDVCDGSECVNRVSETRHAVVANPDFATRQAGSVTANLAPGKPYGLQVVSVDDGDFEVTYTLSWIGVGRNGHLASSGNPTKYALNVTTDIDEAWGYVELIELSNEESGKKNATKWVQTKGGDDGDHPGRATFGSITLDKRAWAFQDLKQQIFFTVQAFVEQQSTNEMFYSQPSDVVVKILEPSPVGSTAVRSHAHDEL